MKTALQILLLILSVYSCKQDNEVFKTLNFKNFAEWWSYQNNEINLNGDFDGRNSNNKKISKKIFLDSLQSGKFIPIKIQNKNNKEIYFLQKIDKNNSDFSSTIKQLAEIQIFYLNWENKVFPTFNFTDINGNKYSTENTTDKKIYLKTYFIACQACNEEMPELNKFAIENKDIIFLSLALDDSEQLKKFLRNKEYKYNFIAN